MPEASLHIVPLPMAAAAVTPPRPTVVPTPARRRDSRIDVLRGLALVMIFINHVPGTIFEYATSRNFGFSDAAEGFVFLAGVSAALAYTGGMTVRPLWPGIRRIWHRAWALYLIHLLITFWAMAIVAATLRYGGSGVLFGNDNFQILVSDPIGVLIGLPLLGHQFGYVNILPLYSVLLLAAPGLLLAAMKWPRLTLAGSIGLWIAVGLAHVDLPNLPLAGGWFFNPLSWQLLFTLGLLTGLAMKRGKRFVPRRQDLTLIAGFFLVFVLVWMKWATLGHAANATLGWAATHGVPGLLRNFDKTYVSVPRLTHFLALAYVLSVIPGLRRICDSTPLSPLALLGRHALPVFALGTILSFVVRAVKEIAIVPSSALDTVLVVSGIVAMIGFAATLDFSRRAATRPVVAVA